MRAIKLLPIILLLTSCTYSRKVPVIKNIKLICKNISTSMFYVNGVWRTKDQAGDTIDDVLAPALGIKRSDINLFYNYTEGKLEDIRQTEKQLRYEINIATSKVPDIEDPLNDKNIYNMEEREEINNVKNVIMSKDNTLLISHSQGNLFANRMCDYVGHEKLNNFQLATPSFKKSDCNRNYFTFYTDIIIGLVRKSAHRGFEPLPANIENKQTKEDPTGHFAETYILNQKIKSSLNNVAFDFKQDPKEESLTLSLYSSDQDSAFQNLERLKTLEISCKNISENLVPFKLSPLEELKGQLLMKLGLGWRVITVKSKKFSEKGFMANRKSINEFVAEKKIVGNKAEYTIGYRQTLKP